MNNDTLQDYLALSGRVLLAVIFVVSGYNKIVGWEATAGYMSSKGLPALLLTPTILLELGGSLMLIIGYHARLAAAALFLFLIPVTFIFHNFWAVSPVEVQMQSINFMKNLGIMGGMLFIVAYGPGRYSLNKR